MNRLSGFLFYLLLFFFSSSIKGQDNSSPKLGFALSGGGAKGIAHIGMLKVLEEEGIYPDYITGTSMGSIVGGLYAIGYTAADLEKMAHDLDWSYFFNDNLDRSYLSIEEKSQADRYQVSFPFENGKIKLPKGLVSGIKMSLLLSRLTVPAHEIGHFDQFKIPFRCVATNLVNGEAVVFEDGFLPDAIRSSMSIPTVFEPNEVNDQLLVDGALVRNLPVQDAFDLGADLVLALDVGGPLFKKEEFSSVLTVLQQTGSFMTEISNQEQRKLASILIAPEINDFSALSFDQIDTLLALGEAAARAKLPELKRLLKDYQPRFPSADEKPKNILRDSFLIQGVDFQVSSSESIETLKSFFQLSLPNVLSLKKIEEKLKQVYRTRFFKKLDYRLLPADEHGYILVIRAQEQGGSFVKASANYDSDYEGGILLNGTFRNLLLNRSKLSIDLRVSEKPALLGEYLVYTPSRPNIGIRLSGQFNFFPGFFYLNNEFRNEFDWRHGVLRLDFFTGITSRLSFSVGYGFEVISQNNKFFDPDRAQEQLKQQSAYFNINRDTYNRLHFPTEGSILSIKSKLIPTGNLEKATTVTTEESIELSYTLTGRFSKAFSLNPKITLHWNNFGGIQDYSIEGNLVNLFYIGREIPYEEQHISFYGLRYMELPVNRYAFSGLILQIEPFVNKFISLGFNYGYFESPEYTFFETTQPIVVPASEGTLGGVGLDLGILTTIGPAWFSTQYNLETENLNFVLHLGYVF